MIDKSLELIEKEILDEMAQYPSNVYFEINTDTRVVTVPDAEKVLGVVTDSKSERKYFVMPNELANGIKAMDCIISVHYINANGDANKYYVEDKKVINRMISFSWELARDVTLIDGIVSFSVCLEKINGSTVTNRWNTTITKAVVLEGINADRQIEVPDEEIQGGSLAALVASNTNRISALESKQSINVIGNRLVIGSNF